jgi:hypothetical protein
MGKMSGPERQTRELLRGIAAERIRTLRRKEADLVQQLREVRRALGRSDWYESVSPSAPAQPGEDS